MIVGRKERGAVMRDKRIVLTVNTEKYTYHREMADLFEETLITLEPHAEVRVFDMADGRPLHEIYYALCEYDAHTLISFDCAGFELQTENDTISYNLFPYRMAHILFQGMHRYREELHQQLNFSMFVYSMREDDVAAIRERYPNIPNILLMDKLEYRQMDENGKNGNRKVIAGWYGAYKKETQA